jgi:peptidoglycan/LPS O-acetylase OafA/YrhL
MTVATTLSGSPGADNPRSGGAAARFDALDGYRAFAALAVLAYHVAGAVGVMGMGSRWSLLIANLGNSAVTVFFVLSGFLLYRPFVVSHFGGGQPPAGRAYLRNRLLRIFPAFWFAAIGYTVLVGPRFEPTVFNYVSAFTLTGSYRTGDYFSQSMLGVDWTLTIELAFYFTLPLLAAAVGAVVRRASTPKRQLGVELGALVALVVIALTYRAVVVSMLRAQGLQSNLWLPNYLDWFALGMLLAVLWAWRARGGRLPAVVESMASSWWVCWLLAAWCYAVASALKFHVTGGALFAAEPLGFKMIRFGLNGMAGFLLVMPAVLGADAPSRIRQLLCQRVVVWLGTVSFGIYLWHMAWLRWFTPRFPSAGFWPTLAFVVVMAVAMAAVSWYAVERPLMRWRSAGVQRAGSAPTVTESR